MGINPRAKEVEANLRARDYSVDTRLPNLYRFQKQRMDFYFVRATEGHLHLIFNPDLFGLLLSAKPKCRQIRISKNNSMEYPKYSAADGPATSCGIGAVFENDEWNHCKDVLATMEQSQ